MRENTGSRCEPVRDEERGIVNRKRRIVNSYKASGPNAPILAEIRISRAIRSQRHSFHTRIDLFPTAVIAFAHHDVEISKGLMSCPDTVCMQWLLSNKPAEYRCSTESTDASTSARYVESVNTVSGSFPFQTWPAATSTWPCSRAIPNSTGCILRVPD